LYGNFSGYPGRLINLPGAVVNLQADVNIDNSIYGGGQLVNEGALEKTGGTSTSSINAALNNSGTLNIQTGTVSLTGGYSLTDCTLDFGISSASSFGQLVLPDVFTLNATTLGVIANGYTPRAGDSFPLITYTSETGVFSAFNLPPKADWQVNYGPTAFSLDVASTAAPFLTLETVTPTGSTNNFTLLLLGPVGSNYVIEASTNLAGPNWTTVTSFVSTASSFYFTDTNTASYDARFFRAAIH
jgi:hypothetical protein